jgi:putative glycerol-1-phosphate prenyltransferase
MMCHTYDRLIKARDEKGAGYLVLLDPDRRTRQELLEMALACEAGGADGLLIGSSILFFAEFDSLIKSIKDAVSIPVILFPGSSMQLSKHADAVLFLSIISGRNPHYLIGEQVLAAPTVHAMGLEAISTGYMLVESGQMTSAQFMSNTTPLPSNKPDIALAHALAAQYLGFDCIYLEAGSGAEHPIPDPIIRSVSRVTVPIIVGGGIRTPETAASKVEAGASFIVTGNIIEHEGPEAVEAFARAIHNRESK